MAYQFTLSVHIKFENSNSSLGVMTKEEKSVIRIEMAVAKPRHIQNIPPLSHSPTNAIPGIPKSKMSLCIKNTQKYGQ